MAIAFVRAAAITLGGASASKASRTSMLGDVPAAGHAAGNTLTVVTFQSNGTLTPTLTDSKGNTYTELASSGTGCTRIWGSVLTTALVSGDRLTCQWGGSAQTKSAMNWVEWSGLSLTEDVASTGAAGDSTTPSTTLTNPSSGTLVIGACGGDTSTSAGWGNDSDTTNGSWGTPSGASNPLITAGTGGGSAASNVFILCQSKLLTATGDQTYNPVWPNTTWEVTAVALQATPSGTAFTRNVDDTLSLADAIASTDRGFGVIPADTATVADAASTISTWNQFPADAATVADTPTPSSGFDRTLAGDTATVADSATPQSGKTTSPADTLTVADSASTQAGKGANLADSLSVAANTNVGGLKLFDSLIAWDAGQSFTLDLDYIAQPNRGSAQPLLGQTVIGTALGAAVGGHVPAVYIDDAGALRVSLFWSGTIQTSVPYANADDGVQHHLTVTFDGSAQRVYVDGTQVDNKAWSNTQYNAGGYSYFAGASSMTGGWPSIGSAIDANGWAYLPSGSAVSNPTFRSGVQAPLVTGTVDATALGQGKAVADSAAVADAQSTQSNVQVFPADTATVADAQTPAAGFNRAPADTATVADSKSFSYGFNITPTDTASVVDAAVAASGFSRTTADTATVADTQSASAGFNQTPADTATVVDAQSMQSNTSRSIADALQVADDPNPSVVDSFNRADENPLSGAGNWTTFSYVGTPLKVVSNQIVPSAGGNLESGSCWTSAFARSAPVEAFVEVPAVGSFDWVSLVYANNASWSGDGFQLFYNGGTRANYFHLDTYDPSTTGYDFGPTQLSAGDAFGWRLNRGRIFVYARYSGVWTQLGSFPLGAMASATYLVAVTMVAGRGWILDNFAAGSPNPGVSEDAGYNSSVPDSLTIADATSTQSSGGQSISDTAAVADSASTTSTYNTFPSDTAAVADAQSTASGLNAFPADAITLADLLTTSQGWGILLADPLTVADAALAASGVQALLADNITVADATSIASAVQQALADTAAVADAQAFQQALDRALADTAVVADSTSSSLDRSVTVTDILVIADARAFGINKSLLDSLTLDDSLNIVGSGVSATYIHHRPPLNGDIEFQGSSGLVVAVATNELVAVYTAGGLVLLLDDEGEIV